MVFGVFRAWRKVSGEELRGDPPTQSIPRIGGLRQNVLHRKTARERERERERQKERSITNLLKLQNRMEQDKLQLITYKQVLCNLRKPSGNTMAGISSLDCGKLDNPLASTLIYCNQSQQQHGIIVWVL